MNSINFTHKTDSKLDCEIVHFPNANFKLDSGDSINDIKIADNWARLKTLSLCVR